MNLRIITPPTAEPMTLGEAMQHLNMDLDDRRRDDWINRQIRTAREACEEFLEFPLTDAVYEYRVDRFTSALNCNGIVLPLGYIGEVLDVKYIDENGDEQTLATSVYSFDDHPRTPTVRLAYGQSWPATRCEANAVRITFTGVYSETRSPPNDPPEAVKSAMGLMIAHWDANREAVVVGQVSSVEVALSAMYLLQPLRLGMGV